MNTTTRWIFFPGLLLGMLSLLMLTNALAQYPLSVHAATLLDSGVNLPQAVSPPAGTAAEAAASPDSAANAPASAGAEGPGCGLAGNHPGSVLAWCANIQRAAANHGLDPNLVAALVTIESLGDPQAYSVNGAVGLMQVMPSDGPAAEFMCINGPCFANRPSSAALFDPDFNLDYGCGMLAGLIQRHGDLREALTAYGPMGVGYFYADKVLEVYENAR